MKILCNYTPCGPHFVRNGWRRVFEALGHQFTFWNPQLKPAFDAFSEVEPDIYLGTTYETDRAVAKNIGLRPHLKVALFGSAWGPRLDDVDLTRYPLVVATKQEKLTIESLRDRISFVFIHAHGEWLEGTMSGWREIGVEPIGILNAADTFVYLNGKVRPELTCDLAFVGGYWGYKAGNLDKFLLPLCHPARGYSVKIFGNSPWPVAQYLGQVDDETVPDLFASATISPSVSEPHSTDLGWDVIERPFKVLSSGGFCVSDHVAEGRDLFNEVELPMAKTPAEMAEVVEFYVKNPERRSPLMAAGKRAVLRSHTYFDRVCDMFMGFGLLKEAARTLRLKDELLNLKGQP